MRRRDLRSGTDTDQHAGHAGDCHAYEYGSADCHGYEYSCAERNADQNHTARDHDTHEDAAACWPSHYR